MAGDCYGGMDDGVHVGGWLIARACAMRWRYATWNVCANYLLGHTFFGAQRCKFVTEQLEAPVRELWNALSSHEQHDLLYCLWRLSKYAFKQPSR